MLEIWKDIKGFEGKYQISNLGNVKSLNYKKEIGKENILSPIKNNGYLSVCLKLRKNVRSIHRLVAEAFIENIENKKTVNHKNGNKSDNRLCNLEWNTYSENKRHYYNVLLGKTGTEKKVFQLTMDKKLIKIWESQAEAGRCGFSQGIICECCKGKRPTHKGFLWKYKEEASLAVNK